MLATVVVSNDGHSHSVACTMESGDNILVAARGSLVRTRVATLNVAIVNLIAQRAHATESNVAGVGKA